ncbi:MAG TPA: hypothetical protein VJY62_07510, partial [Bacteroidia bacterium]|nr:hypothetical protein [Bacteroidia bacterium]
MLKITSLCIICGFLFFSSPVKGQNQYNIWYFGDSSGVDFNSGIPVALSNSSMYAFEGCAVMCDSSGNILFYTNGGDHGAWQGGVWNRNHVLMPNGDLNGFNGCNSADQSSLIIPAPGNPSLFYLFTLDCIENGLAGGLRFSIIDMTLDNNNGDITVKDSL